ncbi:hypothetical protein ACSYAD_21680 [Acaryochloris marina NIES-2412]|uniref:hypothetical protein n=1 Tax=Acaryochloris marina TaxID=155978 RepID=UPI004059B7E7
MQPTTRNISIALVAGTVLSQLLVSSPAQAHPRQNFAKATNVRLIHNNHSKTNNKVTRFAAVKRENRPTFQTPALAPLSQYKICNNSSEMVHYSLNEANHSLPAQYCVTWKLRGQVLLSFDKLFTPGYQEQTYGLKTGQYVFQSYGWSKVQQRAGNQPTGLNLFRS